MLRYISVSRAFNSYSVIEPSNLYDQYLIVSGFITMSIIQVDCNEIANNNGFVDGVVRGEL
jgi:hypothetical protein